MESRSQWKKKQKTARRECRRIPRTVPRSQSQLWYQRTNHVMYVCVLSSESACPHQVYIAVIKSPGINFAYAQLCAWKWPRQNYPNRKRGAASRSFTGTHYEYVWVNIFIVLSARWVYRERNTVALSIINCPIKIGLYCVATRIDGIKICQEFHTYTHMHICVYIHKVFYLILFTSIHILKIWETMIIRRSR